MYDFPQKNIRARLFNAFMLVISGLPPVRKVMEQTMKEHMVMPYRKVLKAE